MMESGGRWWWWGVVISGAVIVSCGGGNWSKGEEKVAVSRIAFGSCADQNSPQPIWNAIIKYDPQVFIWMGDNIYGDIKRPFRVFGKERTIGPWKNAARFVPATQQQMEAKYYLLKTSPAYSRLRHNAKIVGTWDDHDYGLNDAGKEFSAKVFNQRLLLDFLDEPQDSPRRKQAGVYASYTFGPVGRQIKIILLDTRYHRDPLSSDGTILGSSQWVWLEKQLKGPASALTLIGSSIQVISNLSAVTRPLFSMESWGRFPKERDRLFKLIAESKVSVIGAITDCFLGQRDGVFFISGDVHYGEITRYDCAVGYPLYDITSSGLTQAVEKVAPPPLHFIVRFLAWLTPSTMRVLGRNCRRKSCTYGEPNFGVIEIDWNATPVAVKFEVRDINGLPVSGVHIPISELHAQSTNSVATVKVGEHQRHCSFEVSLPWIVKYRLAIFFFCTVTVLLLAWVGLSFAAISAFRLCVCKSKRD